MAVTDMTFNEAVRSAALAYLMGGGGGGGGGGAVTIADGADVTQGSTDDLAWDGASADATLVAIGKAGVGALTNTQVSVGGNIASQMVVLNPDGTVVDFSEATDALPQTEVNPDTRTRTVVNATGAGAITVLDLDAAKRQVVTYLFLSFSAAGNVVITDAGVTVTLPVFAGETWILDDNPTGHFVANVGEAFTIDPSVSMTITGVVHSVKVD